MAMLLKVGRYALFAFALSIGAAIAHVTEHHSASYFTGATVASASTEREVHYPLPALPAPMVQVVPLRNGLGEAFQRGKLITGATSHRLILFTFDDGPDKHTTPRLLQKLDEVGVRAVFFITAARIRGDSRQQREQGEIAREAIRRGHTLASHTVDHLQLPLLGDKAVIEQLQAAEDIFQSVLGARPWLFRPPGGARSKRVDERIAERGYTTVLWNLGAGDIQVHTAEDVFTTWKRVMERREREQGDRGGIVLLHDTREWSVEAFDRIYAELMRRNCELLDRHEELYDIVDDVSFFYEPLGNAVVGTEASPAHLNSQVLKARQARLVEETAIRCAREAAANPS